MKTLFFIASITLVTLALSRCGDGVCVENCDKFNGNTMSNDFHHTAFVTSARFAGNLGGTAGADALCDKIANEGLQTRGRGGVWKSILSDSQSSAKDRLNLKVGASLKNSKEELVVEQATDLWKGSLLAAIQFDENGNQINDRLEVWSGTTTEGVPTEGPTLVTSCTDWNDNTTVTNGGNVGILNSTGAGWIQSDEFVGCAKTDEKARLYCVNSL